MFSDGGSDQTCVAVFSSSGVTLPVFEHYQEGGDSKSSWSMFSQLFTVRAMAVSGLTRCL